VTVLYIVLKVNSIALVSREEKRAQNSVLAISYCLRLQRRLNTNLYYRSTYCYKNHIFTNKTCANEKSQNWKRWKLAMHGYLRPFIYVSRSGF